MDWGGRTGQIINLLHLQKNGESDIVPDYFKSFVIEKVINIFLSASKVIVKANNFFPLVKKILAKMRAYKSCSSGNQYFHGLIYNL